MNPEQIADYAPLFGMFFPTDLEGLADSLEEIRKARCLYGPTAPTCDCKYLDRGRKLGQGEMSGCCELRAASKLLRALATQDLVAMQRTIDAQAAQLKAIRWALNDG